MTLNGWIQILLFCAVVAALAKPLGAYLTRVLDGDLRRPRGRSSGRSTASPAIDPREEQSWLGYALALLAFNLAGFLAPLRAAAPAGRAAAQPGGHGRGAAGARVQHRRLLRHQHQLAELRRRDDDEPSHPDGRAHGAELRLRRDRHRRRGRGDPRLRPGLDAERRQLLGRSHPDHPLRAAADLASCSRWS